MVSKQQEKRIEQLMASISEARRNDRSKEEIQRRVNELYAYLERIGAVDT